MMNVIWVGLGGFCGAALRYLIGLLVERLQWFGHYSLATLAVNVVGCFFMGLWIYHVESRPDIMPVWLQLFLKIGLLGGFTTFSAFGADMFHLSRKTAVWHWLGHSFFQVAFCFLALFLSYWIMRTFFAVGT